MLWPAVSNASRIKVSTFGFKTDPSLALMQALKSDYDTLVIDLQQEDWVLTPMRIRNIANKVILLEKGVVLRAKPGAYTHRNDCLLKFIECTNIQILGTDNLLQMNKEEYVDGEWRNVIGLRNCKDVVIRNLTVRDSGGDGIYIDGFAKGTYSENIKICYVKSLNNKRQGISIISAKNVWIENCLFADTIGTFPGAGIDLEPDRKDNILEQITIINCVFQNNYNAGVKIALHKLEADSKPISVLFKGCSLINNHSVDNPKPSSEILIGANALTPVKGEIRFEDCTIKDSKWGILFSRKRADGFKVVFDGCKALDICQKTTGPMVYLEAPDGRIDVGPLGGFEFHDLKVKYRRNVPLLQVRGSRWRTMKFQDFHFDVSYDAPLDQPVEYIRHSEGRNVNVHIDAKRAKMP